MRSTQFSNFRWKHSNTGCPENTGRFIMFFVITNVYNNKTKGPTSVELFTATGQLNFFWTTRDVRCLRHGWNGTYWYDIQVLATHTSTWVHRYSSLLQWSVPLGQRGHVALVWRTSTSHHCHHCSSEEYRCTHVDACVTRTWISYRCVPCHPWCIHRISV
jgi:hypothetical protein